tara:strand:+ start:1148 stop:1321 length:174 start_codon:yes stop_codon:yes gene_type:complete
LKLKTEPISFEKKAVFPLEVGALIRNIAVRTEDNVFRTLDITPEKLKQVKARRIALK